MKIKKIPITLEKFHAPKQGELADYYHRKVEAGKKKMAVLNAVRNKIIHRIFACVRDNRKIVVLLKR